MITVSQLVKWRSEALREAARTTLENVGRIKISEETCRRAFYEATSWQGKSRDAAEHKVGEVVDGSGKVRRRLEELSEALTLAARELDESAHTVAQRTSEARSKGFRVAENGQVTGGDPGEADFLRHTIQGALARAGTAEANAAKTLHGFADVLAQSAFS